MQITFFYTIQVFLENFFIVSFRQPHQTFSIFFSITKSNNLPFLFNRRPSSPVSNIRINQKLTEMAATHLPQLHSFLCENLINLSMHKLYKLKPYVTNTFRRVVNLATGKYVFSCLFLLKKTFRNQFCFVPYTYNLSIWHDCLTKLHLDFRNLCTDIPTCYEIPYFQFFYKFRG